MSLFPPCSFICLQFSRSSHCLSHHCSLALSLVFLSWLFSFLCSLFFSSVLWCFHFLVCSFTFSFLLLHVVWEELLHLDPAVSTATVFTISFSLFSLSSVVVFSFLLLCYLMALCSLFYSLSLLFFTAFFCLMKFSWRCHATRCYGLCLHANPAALWKSSCYFCIFV